MVLASVALRVKTTSLGSAPDERRNLLARRLDHGRAARPSACTEDAAPTMLQRSSDGIACASGRSGVVALWSR